jgi:hypothetical protein
VVDHELRLQKGIAFLFHPRQIQRRLLPTGHVECPLSDRLEPRLQRWRDLAKTVAGEAKVLGDQVVQVRLDLLGDEVGNQRGVHCNQIQLPSSALPGFVLASMCRLLDLP